MAGTAANQTKSYTLWAWGQPKSGNLGLGNNTDYSEPQQIGGDDDWTPMVAMGSHTCHAIKSDGTLWAWGQGALRGSGTNTTISSPVQVGTATNWYYVATGYTKVYAINTSGELWLWGANGDGDLGTGNTTTQSSMVQLAGTTWAAAGGGNDFSVAVKTDGTAWGWGNGANGRTWHNTTTDYSSPVQGVADTTWWGGNGDIDITDGWEAGIETTKLHGRAQGYWSSMMIDENNKLWGAGWPYVGNYAISGANNSPRQVGTDTTWTNLDHTGFGGTGINNGAFKVWGGYNTTGDLGQGNTTGATAGVLYGWDGTSTDCSAGHNLGAQRFNGQIVGGTIYFSGHNYNGQFGKGNQTNYSSPVQGPSGSDWVKVVIGETGCIGVMYS